jgi:Zn-dependent peptidase ImmA (M78 family)
MDEMLLTLLKTRQNLANLAHRFGVSISYVTKAFDR